MIGLEIDSTINTDRNATRSFVSIGGIPIATVSTDPQLSLKVEGAMNRFLVEETEPDITISAALDDLSDDVNGEMLFDSGSLWQVYRQNGNYLFRFTTPHFGNTPYKIASFNQDFSIGEIRLHRPYFAEAGAVYPLEYPLDELLMLNLLARGRGIELHSCGITDEAGEGFLFVGQSGAGKTTTARIWEKMGTVKILSDDRIIVRREVDAFRMYGTPWHGEGELSAPSSAPLKRIFFLKHGTENRLTRLGKVEAAARLFSCSFPTFYNTDGLDFTLSFFDEMTSTVPCYELSFIPDQSVVEFIRENDR